MSDINDELEALGLLPDFNKEYRRWMSADVSKLALKRKECAPSTEDKSVPTTRHSKRKKAADPGHNEEPNEDINDVQDTPQETTRQSRNVARRSGRFRRGGSTGTRTRKEASPVITNAVPFTIEDSDDEGVGNISSVSLEATDEIENYEMSVKVMWKSKNIHRFKIRKHQKMKCVFEFFGNLEDVPEDRLLFMLNDKQIQPDDTPVSLGLSVVDFIDGGITTLSATGTTSTKEQPQKEGDLELKILCQDRKKPLAVTIQKEEKMKILMIKVAEILEIPQERLKFTFDGEFVNSGDTPSDLDLEGGECIEVNIVT